MQAGPNSNRDSQERGSSLLERLQLDGTSSASPVHQPHGVWFLERDHGPGNRLCEGNQERIQRPSFGVIDEEDLIWLPGRIVATHQKHTVARSRGPQEIA